VIGDLARVIRVRRDGAWKSADAGCSWSRLPVAARGVFSLAVSLSDGTVYAGCEPSRPFASRYAGAGWCELEPLVAAAVGSELGYPAATVDLARQRHRPAPASRQRERGSSLAGWDVTAWHVMRATKRARSAAHDWA